MSSIEDTEGEGFSRSSASDPTRNDSVPGIQEAWRDSDRTTEVYNNPVESNGAHSNASLFGGTVQTDLAGFTPTRWVPKSHQIHGIEWLVTRPEGALFFPPGMGKTSVTLEAQATLGRMGQPNKMLVVAPLMVCLTTWQSEPLKWGQFYQLKVGLAHGPDKELILNDPYYDIVILNYDGLDWASKLLARGHHYSIIVFDELTRLKNTKSKRFAAIKPILKSFKFRWGLTGTPAANGLMDLFGQCYVLDLGKRLGRFITHFRLKYLYQEPWDQYRYYIKPEKAKLLVENISDMCLYLDPKDYLDLPGLIDVPIPVTLPPDVMVKYKFLEEEFIFKLREGVVTAANAGVLTSKLRQFTGGAIYYGEAREWEELHDAKTKALEQLVESMAGEPLLVAYQFNHELIRLMRKFPDALAIKGGMAKGELAQIVEKWNSGDIPLLFVQPTAAAHGLNLQFGGSAICWFSMTYNLEEFVQLIARLNRQGQRKLVRNYMLLANKTIDLLVAKIMVQKDATQNQVFDTLLELAK